ncbi:MAG: phosphoribosyltransferase family protein, partial [Candidatus Berkelbacteria bacterium]|nr:phosphoribosyltransferase family protein [Candidatus Berkelbacteria bacterium]
MIFKNREEAGFLLSQKLKNTKGDFLIVAIPRGGVIVGKIIALNLKTPLEIVVVRKIGAPNNPELAIGAIGPERIVYWDEELIRRLKVTRAQRLELRDQKQEEQRERERKLKGEKPYV